MSAVLVVAEVLRRQVGEVTFELLGKGREVAERLGLPLEVAVPGGDVPLDRMGLAQCVWVVRHPALEEFIPDAQARALASLLAHRQPRLVLVANTAVGMDLAGGLAGLLEWPLVSYCVDLQVEDGSLVAVSEVYGGKLLARSRLPEGPSLVAVQAGVFPAEAGQREGTPKVEVWEPSGMEAARVRLRRWIEPEAADVDITRAEVLVSVGRGIQSPDNLPMAEELAEVLGGVVAASRPVVDAGWLPRSRQVGKSGLTVSPRLYFALGISGAPEHLEGMKGAGLIIAINTDPKAPIFDVAHYGVVGDLFEIVPALVERLRSR